jgi:hypothetical protein
VVARQACQPRERRPRRKDDRRPSAAADLVEETIAYFPYNDVKGERLADRGKHRRLWVAYFRKCFEIRGGVIVWTTRPVNIPTST